MKSILEWILLAVAVAVGLVLAYIDSLPNWDDAGIVAGCLFLASGLVTLLGYRRPWLTALAAGIWVPLRGILASHDLSLALVLIFPFLGAYAGSFIRSGVCKARPAA